MEERNMDMKIVGITVAILVSITVLAGVLMPVLDDATTTEVTLTNTGYARMSETEEETVITWTPSVDRTIINVNGEDFSLSGFPKTFNTSYSIAFADDFILRVYMDGAGPQNIQIWQSGYRNGASSSSTYTSTFTISSSTLSFNSGAPDAVTSTYTHTGGYFCVDPDGDYIMKPKDSTAYLLGDSSVIYAGGISGYADNALGGLYFEGTVGDYTFTPMLTGVTIDNIQTDYTEVSEYVGVISLSKITFDTTYNSNVVHQTYSYFLVPYEITAELSQHLTGNQIELLDVIPVLVIVAILLGVIALVIRSRLD